MEREWREESNGQPPPNKRARTEGEGGAVVEVGRINSAQPHPHPQQLQQTNGASSTEPRPLRLEKSIFGIYEVEGVLRRVSDFLYAHAETPDVEIEAKFGFLIDMGSRERLYLPITCETEVTATNLTFQSSVPMEMFKLWNDKLNERFHASKQPGYRGKKVSYAHFREVDEFYQDNVRVTKDEAGHEKRVICKKRLKDLNIFSPSSIVDFRLSASTEIQVPRPQTTPRHQRHKERISYRFELFSFDLTKVEKKDRHGSSTTYEMEIELADMVLLRAERAKVANKLPNEFLAVASALLNNIHAFLMLANQLQLRVRE